MGFLLTSVLSGTLPAKAAKSWNDEMENALDEILLDRDLKGKTVTVAGPPDYEDRPWWWGK